MRVFNRIGSGFAVWACCWLFAGCAPMMGQLQRIRPKAIETEYFRWSHVDFSAAFEASGPMKTFRKGRVTVHAPERVAKIAEQLAEKTDKCYGAVEKACGVRWRFDTELYLLPVFVMPENVNFKARKATTVVAAVFVLPEDASVMDLAERNPFFPEAWAHEMTEGTMVFPEDDEPAFLIDPCLGPFGWNFGTRWFRDGLSNYAGLVATRELGDPESTAKSGSGRPFSSLALARTSLLKWSQCHGAGSVDGLSAQHLYSAALGIILEIEQYAGSKAIAKLARHFPAGSAVDGKAVERALSEALGFRLRDFLRDYRFPYIGVELARKWPEKDLLEIKRVAENSPAADAGFRKGDALLELEGKRVETLWRLEKALREAGVGADVKFTVGRNGKRMTINVRLGEFTRDVLGKRRKKEPIVSGVAASVRPIY